MIAPYLPGSTDWRSYALRGVVIHVARSATTRSVGFTGGGRDGDYEPEGTAGRAVLDAMVSGIDGVPRGCDYEVASEDALLAIETRLAAESGGPGVISRGPGGSVDVALALLDLPMRAGTTRSWSVQKGWRLDVEVGSEGDATARAWAWAWGKDPGDWLVTTLGEMQIPVVVKGGTGNSATVVVPRAAVHALLGRAIATLGPGELQVHDRRG